MGYNPRTVQEARRDQIRFQDEGTTLKRLTFDRAKAGASAIENTQGYIQAGIHYLRAILAGKFMLRLVPEREHEEATRVREQLVAFCRSTSQYFKSCLNSTQGFSGVLYLCQSVLSYE